ncbi:MAG: glycerol-3-phosphate dehydrogenase, partial [Actinomycetales bacterium]
MAKTTVMGAGSWGTAFAVVLADAGNDVHIWGRRAELCEGINTQHRNLDYLPDIELPETIQATSDAAEALADADVVVLAVPSQQLRANLTDWGKHIPDHAVMVSLMKGVELGTHKRMSEVIAELTGAGPERIAVVSGPNLAKEIALREPAASVVACENEAVALHLQKLCHTAS